MPLVTLTVQNIPAFGAALSGIAFTAGDNAGVCFANDGNTLLLVTNGDAGPHTVTVAGVACNRSFGVAVNQAIVVPNTQWSVAGPFPPTLFNDSGSKVQTTCPDNTGMLYAALRLPNNSMPPA